MLTAKAEVISVSFDEPTNCLKINIFIVKHIKFINHDILQSFKLSSHQLVLLFTAGVSNLFSPRATYRKIYEGLGR